MTLCGRVHVGFSGSALFVGSLACAAVAAVHCTVCRCVLVDFQGRRFALGDWHVLLWHLEFLLALESLKPLDGNAAVMLPQQQHKLCNTVGCQLLNRGPAR